MNDITLTDEGTALDHASGFEYDIHSFDTVSYTHLTLPTKRIV